jgi:Protein of unknown function (DUF2865)
MDRRRRALCTVRRGAFAVAVMTAVVFPLAAAFAQGWWPWSNQEPPRPREPIYRPPPQQQPLPAPSPGSQGPASTAPRYGGICLQLEQRLVAESQRGNQTRDLLPKIEADMRQADRTAQQSQAQLERSDCYDFFLFSKTLKRTRQCIDMAQQADVAKRRLAELDAQRQQILGTRDRSYQDDIIRELARNGCGAQYVQEARRRDQASPFSSLWQDEETPERGAAGNWGTLPFATYRTICVRLCDGYYFPVSFSTLPNHFPRDADVCQSHCAAPAELYYYQNPGGAVEQAVSAKNQQPYSSLRSAFRYRKEYVQGCSCKEAEYVPQAGEKRTDGTHAVPGPASPAASTTPGRTAAHQP